MSRKVENGKNKHSQQCLIWLINNITYASLHRQQTSLDQGRQHCLVLLHIWTITTLTQSEALHGHRSTSEDEVREAEQTWSQELPESFFLLRNEETNGTIQELHWGPRGEVIHNCYVHLLTFTCKKGYVALLLILFCSWPYRK